MSLIDLIRGRRPSAVAAAIPAIWAIHEGVVPETVAVATPAFAGELPSPEHPLAEAPQGVTPDAHNPELRHKVLQQLADHPETTYAYVVDDPDTDPVIVGFGIRNAATCELAIPKRRFSPTELLLAIKDMTDGGAKDVGDIEGGAYSLACAKRTHAELCGGVGGGRTGQGKASVTTTPIATLPLRVRCADCGHFERDTIGDGAGIGACKVKQRARPLWANTERQCDDFEACDDARINLNFQPEIVDIFVYAFQSFPRGRSSG